jgi:hypothetical protein
VLSEKEMNQQLLLPLRLSEVSDEFDLSASDSLVTPSLLIVLSVLRE